MKRWRALSLHTRGAVWMIAGTLAYVGTAVASWLPWSFPDVDGPLIGFSAAAIFRGAYLWGRRDEITERTARAHTIIRQYAAQLHTFRES